MHIKVNEKNDGLLGRLNKLINTVEWIATKGYSPSPYKVEIFPLHDSDGYSIHITIGANPKGSQKDGESWEDFVERIVSGISGQIKPWSIKVRYHSKEMNTRIDEIIDMLERMSDSFKWPSSVWSRADIDKIVEFLIDA